MITVFNFYVAINAYYMIICVPYIRSAFLDYRVLYDNYVFNLVIINLYKDHYDFITIIIYNHDNSYNKAIAAVSINLK